MSVFPGDASTSGLGDTQFSAFLSPADPGEWIRGAGSGDPSYGNMLVQPFLNYNFPDGAYVTTGAPMKFMLPR